MNAADCAKRRRVLAGLAVSVAAVLVSVAGVVAQNVDPQSLVGQWDGNWTEKSESKVNGRYYITIERVEGNRVFGRGEVHSRSGKTEFQFVRTLQGNHLTYGRDNVTDLTIDGNRMEGTAIGRTNWRVKLNKQNELPVTIFSTHPLRRARVACDLLHDRHGALADERDWHRMGAHALTRERPAWGALKRAAQEDQWRG